jgi:3-deoxy-D-manno-octulosonic-acid transferase
MWYFLYNVLLTVAFLCVLPFVPLLVLLGSRYRDGLAQRLGIYPNSVTSFLAAARPVWIHAASVGEVRSAAPLIGKLKAHDPERKILVSTFTSTGHRVARQIRGVDAVIFLPLDLLWCVRRALARFDPSILVMIETEIWPNLVRQAFHRGTPTLLLSGRLSAKALVRYSICRPFFRAVLDCFTILGMQTAADAARITQLGARQNKVTVVGSLKFAREADSEPAERNGLVREYGRQLFVAGSSHRGEEEILLKALASARARFPKLSMVLAPRHPERFAEVERLLKNSPFDFHRKSQVSGEQFFDKDILLLDTVGDLPEFFAAGDIAFVGGSLVDAGGHNILEPARCRKPILFGPHMSNFEHVAEEMKQRGAAIEVGGADDLARVLVNLLVDSVERDRMGEAAAAIAGGDSDALDRNLGLAERFL